MPLSELVGSLIVSEMCHGLVFVTFAYKNNKFWMQSFGINTMHHRAKVKAQPNMIK